MASSRRRGDAGAIDIKKQPIGRRSRQASVVTHVADRLAAVVTDSYDVVEVPILSSTNDAASLADTYKRGELFHSAGTALRLALKRTREAISQRTNAYAATTQATLGEIEFEPLHSAKQETPAREVGEFFKPTMASRMAVGRACRAADRAVSEAIDALENAAIAIDPLVGLKRVAETVELVACALANLAPRDARVSDVAGSLLMIDVYRPDEDTKALTPIVRADDPDLRARLNELFRRDRLMRINELEPAEWRAKIERVDDIAPAAWADWRAAGRRVPWTVGVESLGAMEPVALHAWRAAFQDIPWKTAWDTWSLLDQFEDGIKAKARGTTAAAVAESRRRRSNP